MQAHFKTKVHKRRLKALELEPYSIEGNFYPLNARIVLLKWHLIPFIFFISTFNCTESERAAGHGNFKKAEKRIIETQPSKQELAQGKRVVVQKVSDIDAEMKEEVTQETNWVSYKKNMMIREYFFSLWIIKCIKKSIECGVLFSLMIS